jgi:hypothetical protein
MRGESSENTGMLFDPDEVGRGETQRKRPQSGAEKKLDQVRYVQERDFKNLLNKVNSGKPLTAPEAERLEKYRRDLETEAGIDLPDNIVRSKKAVGEHFGKTKRTIINWAKRGMPESPEGYDLIEIERWAIREGLIPGKVKDDREDNGDSRKNDRAFYETKIKRIESELKEMKLKEARGDLLKKEDIEAQNVAKIVMLKQVLLSIPRGLAPLLVGLDAREIEAKIMEKILESCSQFAGEKDDARSY